ncbi:Metallo-hydrolase/oxidoreductase [Aureobasidium sp. EXF-12298]|nr:Metallo-hydrolase/oxidoreductase [Aureobasidium sp. EXF-12298]KAI4755422.1 Metallo-hydrolase/oxidoreductase [Aureobasidium sp. EXF-12344]KAI4772488.1 Metallo-hydrolase/oxidoreductase [Aureobasidium sp. EXF-3400]
MHIQSIPMWEGSGNNYAYLVVDDKSKDAVIIDPANPSEVLPVLKKQVDSGDINLKHIINTHHHHDHAGGNVEMLKTYPLPIIGGRDCSKVTKTPAHGETFTIGCGRFFEGTAEEMHKALNETLAALPEDTKVYPGHEYTKSNVKFGIQVLQSEPVKKLEAFANANKQTQGKFTIGDEKLHNVFMRLDDPAVQKATGKTSPVDVMAALREMKNKS